jgi:ABC-type branched-subunit amino acid transport system substrate-binding protein
MSRAAIPSVLLTVSVAIALTLVLDGAAARLVTFGVSLGGNTAARVINHLDIERGLNYTCNLINQFPPSARQLRNEGNVTFTCNLKLLRDSGNSTLVYANYMQLAHDASVDFVIGSPPTSDAVSLGVLSMLLEEGRDAIMGVMDSRKSFYARGGYGAPPSSVSTLHSAIPLLVTAGVKSAAILTVAGDLQRETCEGFESQIFYNRVNVSSSQVIASIFDLSPPNDRATVLAAVDRLIAADADVVVICAYNAVLEFVISELRARNYSPKAILTNTVFDPFKDESLRQFVISPTATTQTRARFPPLPLWGSGLGYNAGFQEAMGVPPSDAAIKAYLTIHIYYNAIMTAGTTEQSAVLAALRQTHFDSLIGRVVFGADRQNLLENMIYQMVPNDIIIAGPALATSGRLVYPFPHWDARVSDHSWGKPADIVGLVIIVVTCLGVGGGLVGLIIQWNHSLTIRASRILMAIAHVGAIILVLSFVAWMPGLAGKAACQTRSVLTSLGATLAILPMTLKTGRMAVMFTSRTLKVFAITNGRLIAILAGAVALDLACGTLLASLSSFHTLEVEPVLYEGATNYITCGVDETVFLPVLLVNLARGLFTFIIAFLVVARAFSQIPIDYESARAETMPILINTGVGFFTAAMITLVQFNMPPEQYPIKYILSVSFLCIGVIVSFGFTDYSLFRRIAKGETTSTNSSSSQRMSSSIHSSVSHPPESPSKGGSASRAVRAARATARKEDPDETNSESSTTSSLSSSSSSSTSEEQEQ